MNLKNIVVIMIFLPGICSAGGNEVDSLLRLVKTAKSDKDKVKWLNEAADAAADDELKIDYAGKALKIAEEIDDIAGLGRSYFLIGEAYEYVDYDTAIVLYKKSYDYYEKKDDLPALANILNILGILHKNKGEYQKAVVYYSHALKVVKTTQDKRLLWKIHNNIGLVYLHSGSYERAIEYFIRSLNISEEIDDKKGYATALANLGNLYYNQKRFDKAMEHFQSASKFFQGSGYLLNAANMLHNIGSIYVEQGKYKAALQYIDQSLTIYNKHSDFLGIAMSLNTKANIYTQLENYNESLYYGLMARDLLQKLNNKSHLVTAYIQIGNCYSKLNKFEEAFDHFTQALNIAKEIGNKQLEIDSYNGLYKYFEDLKDHKKALSYYKKYTALSDSLFNEEVSQRMANIMSNAEIEKREKEKALLREQIARQELENKALAGGGIFLLLFALYFFFTTRQKKKANKLLSRQNEEINRKRQQIETISEQKTNLFVNLAHETKTPLTLIHNYLEEYIDKYGLTEETGIIRQNINKLRNDIVNFFDIEKYEKGFDLYRHDQVMDLSQFLEEHLVLFKKYAGKKQVRLKEEICDGIWIKADPAAISRIINNLVENAIKYTPEGGKVEVRLKAENKQIILQIQDTGIGISPTLRKRIFKPYFQINQEKENYQGMGLGLAIVKKIVDSLNGKISLVSVPDRGTTVAVTLPQQNLQTNGQATIQLNGHTMATELPQIKDVISNKNYPYLLLIEDNVAMLNFLCRKLKGKYNIYTALNGREAVKKLDSIQKLDLILCDVMMDVMDGFDFFETIKKRKQFDYVPFIFLTAKNTRESRDLGLKLGAIDYIEKPFRISELIQKIDAVLNLLDRQRFALVSQAYEMINGKSSGEVSHNFELTKREKEIASLIASGKTYNQIAEELHISGKTVSKHIQNIFEKAEVSNKMELVNKLGAVK